MKVSLQDIQAARLRIQDRIQNTHLNYSKSCSLRVGTETYLKLENQQLTGSFKIRGALNKFSCLSEAERAKGIVAASAGNHAQGVACSASQIGISATIVMPETSPLVKVMATQGYGAKVILHGSIYDEAFAFAKELAEKSGATFVHPYEDEQIIAGQGTLGLEVIEALPDLDSIVVPIGGGGLISGVAVAIKSIRPSCKIFGVVSENAPGMAQMVRGMSGHELTRKPTIADGIAVKRPSVKMYESFIKPYVDDVIEVSDEDIAESIVFVLERAKAVVEGSGAVTLAGAIKAGWPLGKKTCLVLSGGNIDMNIIAKVIERGLSKSGRLVRLGVLVQDRPGTLLKLTSIVADHQANILDVKHDRLRSDLQMSETAIEFLLETKSEEQVEKILKAFAQVGATTIR